jgi:predicted lipoprotein with Yx(FWY)xxD motif
MEREAAGTRRLRTHMFVGLSIVAVVALAACGGSSNSSSSKKSTTSTAKKATVEVTTAKNSKFGTILVDSKGMTLYTLTDNGQPVACSGDCAMVWPPLLLPTGTTKVTGSEGVKGLGTVAADGGQLVTHNGAGLYRFSGDQSAGQANGDGINSFGGIWHVVSTSAGSKAPSTTSRSNTGGSGY